MPVITNTYDENHSGGVAQLVRVPDCRSGGCGLEPRRPRLRKASHHVAWPCLCPHPAKTYNPPPPASSRARHRGRSHCRARVRVRLGALMVRFFSAPVARNHFCSGFASFDPSRREKAGHFIPPAAPAGAPGDFGKPTGGLGLLGIPPLAIHEFAEPVSFDDRVMHEDILAIVMDQEPKAFFLQSNHLTVPVNISACNVSVAMATTPSFSAQPNRRKPECTIRPHAAESTVVRAGSFPFARLTRPSRLSVVVYLDRFPYDQRSTTNDRR